jgi:CrcB protein
MFRNLIIVGLGGAGGSILRWLIAQWAVKWHGSGFPWGTFFVNFAGCLLIGIVIQTTDKAGVSGMWRLLLATGFCGGFTTFSAFAVENLRMIESGNYQGFLIYSLLSIAAGIAGVMAGMKLG